MAAEINWHIYGTKYSAADVGPGHAALASLVRYTNRHTGEIALSGNNLGQVVYTHEPLLPSSIIWYWSRCGDVMRLGKVTMAMHHRLQWFIHLRAHGLRKGDEHPAGRLKMRDMNLRHQFARVEIAGHENAGPICRGGKCGKS